MSESTLSLGYSDLLARIGEYMFGEYTPANLSTHQRKQIDYVIQAGLRQFYNPPPVASASGVHHWSFLAPLTTLTMVTDYSTGTIALTNASTTVTLTDGTWPSWAATNGTLVYSNTRYAIASRDGDTQLTLSAAFDGTTATGASYVLDHDARFDLPDDFGSLLGKFTYQDRDEASFNLENVGEGQIRLWRQQNESDGHPCYAAVRPKSTTGATGQRYEVVFYPDPDDTYVFEYRYRVLPNELSDTYPYPYGGMAHAETILQSCLAAAENFIVHESGDQYALFMQRLEASVAADIEANTPYNLGYNGDRSGGGMNGRHRMRNWDNMGFSYTG